MARMTIVQDGKELKTSESYFRGAEPQYYPNDDSLRTDTVVEKYLTYGWMPERGFITKKTPIVVFGSCFAANISDYLHSRGYNVISKCANGSYVTSMGDGMVHTHAILQQFKWAWRNEQPKVELWHGYKAEEFGYGEDARKATRILFDTAEVFVITLGLSEIWYDEVTQEVFWRAPPRNVFDPTRHKFRVSRHDETKKNLIGIFNLIREFRPTAKVVLTVSPIPLAATFRPVSCIAANAVSKAILRSAVDDFYDSSPNKLKDLFYFPSYDIVMYAFNNQWTEDRRHVHIHILDYIMKVFEKFFCVPGISMEALNKSLRRAQQLDRKIGKAGHGVVAKMMEERKAKAMAERIAERKAARARERVAARRAAKAAAKI